MVLCAYDNFCSTVQYLQSKFWGTTASFAPSGDALMAKVTDGHVILILLLRLQTRRQVTLAMENILAWLAKSATDSKMLSSSVVRSLLFHHINLGVKTLHSTIISYRQGIQSSPHLPRRPRCTPQAGQLRPITRNERFLPV